MLLPLGCIATSGQSSFLGIRAKVKMERGEQMQWLLSWGEGSRTRGADRLVALPVVKVWNTMSSPTV